MRASDSNVTPPTTVADSAATAWAGLARMAGASVGGSASGTGVALGRERDGAAGAAVVGVTAVVSTMAAGAAAVGMATAGAAARGLLARSSMPPSPHSHGLLRVSCAVETRSPWMQK